MPIDNLFLVFLAADSHFNTHSACQLIGCVAWKVQRREEATWGSGREEQKDALMGGMEHLSKVYLQPLRRRGIDAGTDSESKVLPRAENQKYDMDGVGWSGC